MIMSTEQQQGERSIFSDDWCCPGCGETIDQEIQAMAYEADHNLGTYLEVCCPGCERVVICELEWTEPEIHAVTPRMAP